MYHDLRMPYASHGAGSADSAAENKTKRQGYGDSRPGSQIQIDSKSEFQVQGGAKGLPTANRNGSFRNSRTQGTGTAFETSKSQPCQLAAIRVAHEATLQRDMDNGKLAVVEQSPSSQQTQKWVIVWCDELAFKGRCSAQLSKLKGLHAFVLRYKTA